MWKLALLFAVLSPGVVLTLPPVGKTILFSGKTSLAAVLAHAALFYLIARYVLVVEEGFGTKGWKEPCLGNAECQSGECKTVMGISKCTKPREPKENGKPCMDDNDCKSKYCNSYKCAPNP